MDIRKLVPVALLLGILALGVRTAWAQEFRIGFVAAITGPASSLGGPERDVAVMLQQFGHWATPVARDLGMPGLNQVATMDLELTDATGSGADLVRVKVYKTRGP